MNYIVAKKNIEKYKRYNNEFINWVNKKPITFHELEIIIDDIDQLYRYTGKVYDIVCIGKIYEKSFDKIMASVENMIETKGLFSIQQMIDGDFVALVYDSRNKKYVLIADELGVCPLYYSINDENIIFTSYPEILFQDFQEADVDKSSVYDFLRYGTLLGNHTFSKKIKVLNGGTYLCFDVKGKIHEINKENIIIFSKDNWEYDEEKLMEDVHLAFKNAVKKRIEGLDENDICVFLSGGLDSRYLLAVLNELTEKRIKCYAFGQAGCDEVEVARRVSEVKGNPFTHIVLTPETFISRVDEYARHTCGADMFMQSVILNCVDQIHEKNFMTGKLMGVLLGGTILDQSVVDNQLDFKSYVDGHLQLLRMNILEDEAFDKICNDASFFCKTNMLNEMEYYEKYCLPEVIQPFFIHTRDIRLTQHREYVPGYYMNNLCPYADKEFIRCISKIPPEVKNDYQFYRKLFLKYVDPEYAVIPYNNTGLPILAPMELWNEGTSCLLKMENLYEKAMKNNHSNNDKIYYPHYYSDFNGYSRYDNSWKQLFSDRLLTEDAYIIKKWFKLDEIKKIYTDHIEGKQNNRKILIYLLTLEIFMSDFLG